MGWGHFSPTPPPQEPHLSRQMDVMLTTDLTGAQETTKFQFGGAVWLWPEPPELSLPDRVPPAQLKTPFLGSFLIGILPLPILWPLTSFCPLPFSLPSSCLPQGSLSPPFPPPPFPLPASQGPGSGRGYCSVCPRLGRDQPPLLPYRQAGPAFLAVTELQGSHQEP